jgi:hypothetical protein
MGGKIRGSRHSYAASRYGISYQNLQSTFNSFQSEDPDNRFETSVNEYLVDILRAFNDRDSETLNQRLESIIEVLESEFEGVIKLKFGGSVSKHTYVDGISDADLLALVHNSSLSDCSPSEVKSYIYEQLSSRLRNIDSIEKGNLAITIRYKDGMEVQLIPALQKYSGYRIPDKNGEQWSPVIRPDKFASKLTNLNQSLSGNVVRVIKLVKGINDQSSTETQISGYHVESLAIELFKKYPSEYPKTLKRMLKYFYENASELVKTNILDKTNQSLHVDDYLGPEHSPQRYLVSFKMKQICEKMERADREKSSEQWKIFL